MVGAKLIGYNVTGLDGSLLFSAAIGNETATRYKLR